MAEESFLSDEFVRQLTAVGAADILIGLPTCNNSGTVERVVKAIHLGLVKYFPRERAVLINPDAGSTDGTPDIVKSFAIEDFRTLLTHNPLRTLDKISTPYPGMEGKGNALRMICVAAELLRAKACAVISPDLQSVTPERIESLVRPVYKDNFDFVAPVYDRPKFEGLLVKNLLSPVVGAAYGQRLREPVASELGFSGRLACHYGEQDVWDKEVARSGIELWMTTTAMVGGFRMCQSFLGPKTQLSRDTRTGLVGTIQRMVGSLFRSLKDHEEYWKATPSAVSLPVFGFEYGLALEPIRVKRKQLLQMFRAGVEQLQPVLESILAADTLPEIRKLASQGEKEFRYPDELWVKTIYEFAGSYHRSVISRDHVLQALTPLYRGRIASFALENEKADAQKIEKRLDNLCGECERLKPYLIERWSSKG